jgi:hypothetical protein
MQSKKKIVFVLPNPEDGDKNVLRNGRKYWPKDMASHTRIFDFVLHVSTVFLLRIHATCTNLLKELTGLREQR